MIESGLFQAFAHASGDPSKMSEDALQRAIDDLEDRYEQLYRKQRAADFEGLPGTANRIGREMDKVESQQKALAEELMKRRSKKK